MKITYEELMNIYDAANDLCGDLESEREMTAAEDYPQAFIDPIQSLAGDAEELSDFFYNLISEREAENKSDFEIPYEDLYEQRKEATETHKEIVKLKKTAMNDPASSCMKESIEKIDNMMLELLLMFNQIMQESSKETPMESPMEPPMKKQKI